LRLHDWRCKKRRVTLRAPAPRGKTVATSSP
jgi:hypothetical protein